MNYKKISQIIAIISCLVGVVVMIGWYLDITILTSILPQWIRMKVATAVCFIFSGIIVFLLSKDTNPKNEIVSLLLIIFSSLLVLIMGTIFFGSILGFRTGMENISFVDKHEVSTPIFQGRPSLATMICFLLIAIIGYLSNLKTEAKIFFSLIGAAVFLIGAVGILGYLLNIPFLAYEIPGISNMIAIHTTILFAILGMAIFLLRKDRS